MYPTIEIKQLPTLPIRMDITKKYARWLWYCTPVINRKTGHRISRPIEKVSISIDKLSCIQTTAKQTPTILCKLARLTINRLIILRYFSTVK